MERTVVYACVVVC